MTSLRRAGWLLLFMGAAVACCSAATATTQGVRESPSSQPTPAAATSWTGTIESDTQNATALSDGHSFQCNDQWHTELSLTVHANDSITGTAKATRTSGPSCSGYFDTAAFSAYPPATEVDLSVAGTKQTTGFKLTFGYVSSDGVIYAGFGSLATQQGISPGPALTIPITGPCAAGGTVPTSDSLETGLVKLTASNVFALQCVPCDPDLMAKADREFANAAVLANAGLDEVKEANKELAQLVTDTVANELLVQVDEKGIGFDIAKLEHAGTLTKATGELVDTSVFWLAIGKLVVELTTDVIPEYLDVRKVKNEAREDFEKGEEWEKRAKADLGQAYAQGACVDPVEGQLNKMLAEQQTDDAVHQQVEKWQAQGSTDLYLVDGQLLDVKAATQKAQALVGGGGRSTQGATSMTAHVTKADLAQLRAALALLQHGAVLEKAAKTKLGVFQGSTKTLASRLAKLLH